MLARKWLSDRSPVVSLAVGDTARAYPLAILYVLGNANVTPGKYLGNKSLSIGVGGGLGILMLLNVWGIIWPIQKRAIAATVAGTPPPPADVMRRAFLASRTNAWLSLPMLFFMGTSHGDYIIFGK